MTELQLYKYIMSEITPCEDELNWHGDTLVLQLFSCQIDEFMTFINEGTNDAPTEITYYHGKIQIDLVPICEGFSIDPENILSKS